MKIRATIVFDDYKCGVKRNVGDVWEADEERLAEINSAGFGIMAERVEPEPEEPKKRPTRARKK